MITIKANFANGDSILTRINLTEREAREYYINRTFNVGSVHDDIQTCIGIDIIVNH